MVTEAPARQAKLDARMMSRALQAAERGNPGPNPRVGAIVARGAKVVTRGFRTHTATELSALARAGTRARGATLYLTLGPSDVAQRTAIVSAGIRRVVIGHAAAASVRNIAAGLKRQGIEVALGVESARCARAIADYEKFAQLGLPDVTLKAAVTLDGRTAARSGESKWITGASARREVHLMRARVDAVLVGVGTVLADDPELTVREVPGVSPLRVVLDSQLRMPLRAKLVTGARSQRTLVLHGDNAPLRRRQQLMAAGVELAVVKLARSGRGLDLLAVLRELGKRDVVRLLVEGGARIHGAWLDAELVDRVAVFIAPCLLADARAFPLAEGQRARSLPQAFRVLDPEVVRLGDDVLVRGPLTRPSARATRATRATSPARPKTRRVGPRDQPEAGRKNGSGPRRRAKL